MQRFRIIIATAVLLTCSPAGAFGAQGDCGQPHSAGDGPVSSDALFVLRAGVALLECELCVCDLNDSGGISSTDALIDLRAVVGQPVELTCPSCSTTTTTTTTTLPTGCPDQDGLDGAVFNEKYTCAEEGDPDYCVDENEPDTLLFEHKGGGKYDIRDVPDTGLVFKTGELDCTTFTWIADSPDGYVETGEWEFDSSLTSFTGSSTYEADDESYFGTCNETGAKDPAVPPDPPTVPPCP